ncbi:glucosyltransferase domain-containing protein [Entomobacter blattae]|uniref:Glucosyl transferase GtrII n=1 Tax=Entomobacter blattae TaxID=2762277 RepID=A0A7H1NQP3_9PROT|nr:glucosyltransferase domain-containing protein [Entomobacter blattae]QNT78103.1 Glucosyl transferase GtrII [Entomobacter blattae]
MRRKYCNILHHPLSRPVAGLTIFLFFYFLYASLFRPDALYRDDNIRHYVGQLFWVDEGRVLSKLSINLFTLSDGAYLSSFPQLFAVGLMAGTTFWAAQEIFGQITLFSLSLLSLLFLNPFYLQNMSYSYDSLPMTLASCAAIFAATSLILPLCFFWLNMLGIGFILYSYQPALGLYASLATFITVKHFMAQQLRFEAKFLVKIIFYLAATLLLLLAYKVTITRIFPQVTGRTLLNIHNVWPNLFHVIDNIRLVFYPNFSTVFSISIGLVLLSLLVRALTITQQPIKVLFIWLWGIFVTIIAFGVIMLNAEGPSLLLPYEPYAQRLLIGTSGLWLLALYIISTMSKGVYIGLYSLFALLCFSFSYSYGAFLHFQDRHSTMIISNVHYDVTHNPALVNNTQLIAQNALPLAPASQFMLKKTPLLAHLFGEQHLLWLSNFKIYPFLEKAIIGPTEKICESIKEMKNSHKAKKILTTPDYALYSYKNTTFVDFYTEKDLFDTCSMRGIK